MIDLTNVKTGLSLTIQKRITEEDTALNYGSGKLERLFATPSLVGLAIEAAAKLADDLLPEGYITVGKVIHIDHSAPTVLGEVVSVKATIKEVDAPKVIIEIEAFDEVGPIGRGMNERYVVDKHILLEKASMREVALENKDY